MQITSPQTIALYLVVAGAVTVILDVVAGAAQSIVVDAAKEFETVCTQVILSMYKKSIV